MTKAATVVKFPVTVALECPKCGAAGQGSCDCGEPYVPAGDRAAKAVAADPSKSDRAIAAEIGTTHKTVARARKSTGDQSPVRVGRDGKRRKMPERDRLRDDWADDWSGCNAPKLPEPPDADPEQYPHQTALFQFRYCCSDAVDKARIASKVLADAGVVGTARLVDDVDNVLGVWREFSDVLTAQLPAKKPGFTRIATTKPTSRKVTRARDTLPLNEQTNHLTRALANFVQDWVATAGTFTGDNPNLDDEYMTSLLQFAESFGQQLQDWALDRKVKLPPPNEPEDNPTNEDLWQRDMLGHAGNASALPAYWTREFGKVWEQYAVASEMIDAARKASEDWQKIAAKLMQMQMQMQARSDK
jgi:hypothetical protein